MSGDAKFYELPLDAGTYVEKSPAGYRVVYVDFGGQVRDVNEFPNTSQRTGYFRLGPLAYALPEQDGAA